jgi:hypothetical protein
MTEEQRQNLGVSLANYFADQKVEGWDCHDSRNVDDLIDRAIAPHAIAVPDLSELKDDQRVCITVADERLAHYDLPTYSALLARSQTPVPVIAEGDAPDHDDDIAVDVFARVMKTKLAEQRAKGYDGWEGCGYQVLSNLLHRCVAKGDPRDVAIVAMMLYHHSAQVVPASDVEPSDAWQPIETAPGGGTTILLRLSKSVSQGRYDPHPSRPEHPWEFIDRSNGASFVNHMVEGNLGPSHWMPMPGVQA